MLLSRLILNLHCISDLLMNPILWRINAFNYLAPVFMSLKGFPWDSENLFIIIIWIILIVNIIFLSLFDYLIDNLNIWRGICTDSILLAFIDRLIMTLFFKFLVLLNVLLNFLLFLRVGGFHFLFLWNYMILF